MLASCVRNVFHKIEIVTLAFSEVSTCEKRPRTSPRAANTLCGASQHLAQSDPAPRPERVNTLHRATLCLAQSKSTPCAEQPCASRSAAQHLALRNPVPCSEQLNTSRRATQNIAQSDSPPRAARGGARTPPSRRASKQLAQREVEMDSKKGLAFFFSDGGQ